MIIRYNDDELTRQELAARLDNALSPAKDFGDVDDTFDQSLNPMADRPQAPRKRPKPTRVPVNMRPGNRAQVRRKANSPW